MSSSETPGLLVNFARPRNGFLNKRQHAERNGAEELGNVRNTDVANSFKVQDHGRRSSGTASEIRTDKEVHKDPPYHISSIPDEMSEIPSSSRAGSIHGPGRLEVSLTPQVLRDGERELEVSNPSAAPSKETRFGLLYQDPTPKTPRELTSPPDSTNDVGSSGIPFLTGNEFTERIVGTGEANDIESAEEDGSRSEIQSIIDQFDPVHELNDQTTNEADTEAVAAAMIGSALHPPRKSSLDPPKSVRTVMKNTVYSDNSGLGHGPLQAQDKPKDESRFKADSIHNDDYQGRFGISEPSSPLCPKSPPSLHKSLPPAPDPEPDLPFDFHRFLEQLRHRTADPVAKFLRSFLVEFGKKQWMVHEQVKIVSDFLVFITAKMGQCEIWREVSDAEFDNAKEGMEKLVMNRLYSQTFSPAIPPPVATSTPKSKRRPVERQVGPGRRGQHQEDVERDDVLAQKVRIYGWIQEHHLDIAPIGETGKRFLALAQQELLKIKTYRAPRDKIICVLNCCKVIFGLLRNSKVSDTSADSFIPLLIYVVLQANPEHLVSNIQYILRFRNQDRLVGEAGYYISSLMGAIQFIENLDRTTLTISDEEFERNVEAAVSAIAERDKDEPPSALQLQHIQALEKATGAEQELARSTPRPLEQFKSTEIHEPVTTPGEKIAVSGLLKTIQKPLSSIGRIFSDDAVSPHFPGNTRSEESSFQGQEVPRRLSPAVFQPPRSSGEYKRAGDTFQASRTTELSAEDAATRQASAEAAEALRIQRTEHKDVVETLAGMFPDLERDVIDDVVRLKEGRVGSAVDACLALNM